MVKNDAYEDEVSDNNGMNPEACLNTTLLSARNTWYKSVSACSLCGRCAPRCVIYERDGDGAKGQSFAARAGLKMLDALQGDATLEGVRSHVWELIQNDEEVYQFVRRCCLCNHCTAYCPSGLRAPDTVKPWRRLFLLTGVLGNADKSIMVDNEWNIFSVYRAVFGIAYPQFQDLASAKPGQADTVFFPGCSLVSYAPDVVCAVGEWFDTNGYRWALCTDCCGSPLISAGLAERSLALRQRILQQCLDAGVKRVVCVCAGCAEELEAVFRGRVQVLQLPQLLCDDGTGHGLAAAGSSANGPDTVKLPDADTVTYAIHDSCHDRAQASGSPLRHMLQDAGARLVELEHSCRNTTCCGAGGAVPAYDPALSKERAEGIMLSAQEAGADVLITSCPTCSYTMAQYALDANDASPFKRVGCKHYLELMFGIDIDWPQVFANLQDMWTGEYGAWVYEQLT
ncbi:MAG: (Fe-S)-binding protein [Coriobacteriales bacterium]|jgi:Fe-S oxidoreductase|nr:(Fe-S)-binding protein [Coriobacteriales bacterium]